MVAMVSSVLLLLAPPHAPALRGPALVVLLKDGCPCARECRFQLDALADACRGKVRFVGILDGDAAKAKALARSAELTFPIVPDPRSALIRALHGHEALDLRLVGADGRLAGAWDGFDRAKVAAALRAADAATGRTIDLDLSALTVLPRPGCAFSP